MRVLGIETSCDESSAAVVDDARDVRSLVTVSQVALHVPSGGVVPEVAAREHVGALPAVVAAAMERADASWGSIDRIAVTAGPGLVGSLLVGVSYARGLAQATGIPLAAVHHVHGHIAGNWLGRPEPPRLPAVVLTVSGGHNELILMRGPAELEILGSSRDDAAGEAYDKVARLLGLPYPGGPAIDRIALNGDPRTVTFPRAWLDDSLDFSFSGLKSAVRREAERAPLTEPRIADIAASFQEAVIDVLATKAARACRAHGVATLLLAGGVSACVPLRERCAALAADDGVEVLWPTQFVYCTDNAAMIAAAGALLPGTHDWRTVDASPSFTLSHALARS